MSHGFYFFEEMGINSTPGPKAKIWLKDIDGEKALIFSISD